MPDTSVYALPREIQDISRCYFYHRMDIPGHGVVGEEWDLRGREEHYLGGVSFQGKRVLELGTASGFLCRYMESRGADVTGFDLSEDSCWDFVPFSQLDLTLFMSQMKAHIERLKNGWWFCHRIFKSKAKVVYGSVYNVPNEIGPVDIATFGSLLLHLRDPFAALRSALRLTRETVVVTDVAPAQQHLRELPVMYFCPSFRTAHQNQSVTWWIISPQIIVEFLGVLGFEKSSISYHKQRFQSSEVELFTVVGKRTREMLPLERAAWRR
jgi:hypothetical protein